jgi:hypothetical protein
MVFAEPFEFIQMVGGTRCAVLARLGAPIVFAFSFRCLERTRHAAAPAATLLFVLGCGHIETKGIVFLHVV